MALALGGGGFLSTTDMAGLTAGLLSVLMTKDASLGAKKDKGEDSLVESGLFSRVETINSISGGSWFASKLIYSEQYRRMIEELAFAKAKGASIAELSEIFQKEDSIVKLANLAENTPTVKLIETFYQSLSILGVSKELLKGFPELKQSLGLILTIVENEGNKLPLQWETVVKYVLGDDIENYKFGHDVQVRRQIENANVVRTILCTCTLSLTFHF